MKKTAVFITCLFMMMGGSTIIGLAGQATPNPPEKPQTETPQVPQKNKMTNAKLLELIKRIDAKPAGQMGNWQIKFEGHMVQIITDEKADRMRMISGVAKTDKMGKDQLYRIMQANFESALDARYAIAQEVVWATFIHPLSPLSEKEFFSGLGQILSLARTYGTTFSSGVFVFGGGDSSNQENIHDKVIKKGSEI